MSSASHVRKGFGLRAEVRGDLRLVYASRLVDALKANDYRLQAGDVTIRLAREFGFCYGVDRAVEYAYETRRKFPERRIILIGEIIHNPHVNERMSEMGIEILPRRQTAGTSLDFVGADDVVIIPAFGLPVADFDRLYRTGCTLVDTTCGSVLNVWKNVERYGRDRFTAIIHGKYAHEETIATASRATSVGGRYLIVHDMEDAEVVAAFIEGRVGADEIRERFMLATSDDFEPDDDLGRLGLANQTTMLSSESLAIECRLRDAICARHGEAELAQRFRAFDTICSATQDRQDAVLALCAHKVDVMLVIGGFNSSNTGHLVEIAGEFTPAFHIEDASALLSLSEIRHQLEGERELVTTKDWLKPGPVTVGVTSGASTPNNRVGEVVERLLALRAIDPGELGLRPDAAATSA